MAVFALCTCVYYYIFAVEAVADVPMPVSEDISILEMCILILNILSEVLSKMSDAGAKLAIETVREYGKAVVDLLKKGVNLDSIREMLKGGVNERLISAFECYPENKEYAERLSGAYCWITGDELTSMVEDEDFQWIWGVFSAFPKNLKKESDGMRDLLKSESYYKKYINMHEQLLERLEEGCNNAKEDEEIRRYVSAIAIEKYKLIKAKYSYGDTLENIHKLFISLLEDMPIFWEKDSSVIYMYDMMALTVLLEEGKETINLLDNLVKKYGRDDGLTDFYVNYINLNNISIDSEISYGTPYVRLKEILLSGNKTEKIKEYIQKYWYKENKGVFWYDTHKMGRDSYYGYWSFEAGAIVKMLKLNDDVLKDIQYYPYDLVHYRG